MKFWESTNHIITQTINHIPTAGKVAVDVTAAGIAWGAIFTDIIPKIAATLSVIWLIMQMWTWIVNKRWKPVKEENEDERET